MIEVVREAMQVESFDGHRVGAFLHRPSAGPAPGLVMIPEIFGINLPLFSARYIRIATDSKIASDPPSPIGS